MSSMDQSLHLEYLTLLRSRGLTVATAKSVLRSAKRINKLRRASPEWKWTKAVIRSNLKSIARSIASAEASVFYQGGVS